MIEADRCLECGGAHAGAVRDGVPGRRRRADVRRRDRGGRPHTAATTIFAENILGGTCARVCPVEILCQRDCVLVHEGRQPIEIGALQRYATEWAYANGVPLPAAGERAGGSR